MPEPAQSSPLHLKTVIAALWTGNLFAPFLVSGVAAILPAIGISLQGSAVALSLVMVCYNLGQSISNMLSGRICDILGVKRVLLAGVGGFCLLGALMGLAPSMPVLIILRFAQGLAAAAISCAVTSLSVTVAPPEKRGQVISTVVTAVYLGLAIGPLACGGITELAGWRLVFFLIAVLGVAELLLLRRVIPERERAGSGRTFDGKGALLASIGLVLVTMGATCTFLHPAMLVLLPAGLVCLTVFLHRDWNAADSILDLRILSGIPGLPSGMAATFINYGAFMGLSVFFSLYLQQILGLNAFTAGSVLMVQSLAQTVFSPWAGRLADRCDPGVVSTSGMAVCGVSILSLTLLGAHSSVWHVILCQIALGTGAAFFVAPNMAATLGNVPRPQMTVAAGLLGCLRTMGGLMSHIIISCMLGFFMGDDGAGPQTAELFLHAMRYALLLFGAFNLLGVLLGLRGVMHHG